MVYATWIPEIIHICKNPTLCLWVGMQQTRWNELLGNKGRLPIDKRKPYEGELAPCECQICNEEQDIRNKRAGGG